MASAGQMKKRFATTSDLLLDTINLSGNEHSSIECKQLIAVHLAGRYLKRNVFKESLL
jgi:hypothetical protein